MNGNIKIKVDSFLKDPRVRICLNTKCKYNMANMKGHSYMGDLTCHFRIIEIDQNGKCKQFEEV